MSRRNLLSISITCMEHPLFHDPRSFTLDWAGRPLTLETGKLAGLANGAVKVQYGETVVLATVTMSGSVREGIDFFPLMVDYEEKLYAAGKIKGSRFVKREGRPSDQAILNARITDRSLRPLFDYNMRNDVQVVLNVLAIDGVHDPAQVALIAASAAVSISDVPWDGPITGVTVAVVDGEYILNPTPEQRQSAELFLLLAVRRGQLVMIEAEGKQADDEVVMKAFEFGLEQGQPVIELISQMQQEIGKPKVEAVTKQHSAEEEAIRQQVEQTVKQYCDSTIASLFGIRSKAERQTKEETVKQGLMDLLDTEEAREMGKRLFEEQYEQAFRDKVLNEKIRVDGRSVDEVRPLYCETDILPRVHGSAVFQRGETQVLSVVTLGAPSAAQIIDELEPEYTKRFMHHYNFPPFSVGEVKPMRGPSRRDIGHGMLAEKAVSAVIPDEKEFPYTIRVVSEVLMSNGSSSQASACGSSLALMAAGVPIKKPVAGIAMGLVMNEDASQYTVLTDIQGIEDHSGDMDFKVAGTDSGVTAIQLDIKLGGITLDICRDTLKQARAARLHILESITATMPAARTELSPYAPRIETLQIDPDKIGELIGPGGKMINSIIEKTGAQIDIEDDGTVFITTADSAAMTHAKDLVSAVTRVIMVGDEFEGEVLQIVKDRNSGSEIGAIVDLGGGKDGMIHISNVCHGRIAQVSQVLNVGDRVKVVVKEVDHEKGRIGLSRKDLITPGTPDPACDIAVQSYTPPTRSFDRDHRGTGRGAYPRRDHDRGHRSHQSDAS